MRLCKVTGSHTTWKVVIIEVNQLNRRTEDTWVRDYLLR